MRSKIILAGIAGIFAPGKKEEVKEMLTKISHRGPEGRAVLELEEAILGGYSLLPMDHYLPDGKKKRW